MMTTFKELRKSAQDWHKAKLEAERVRDASIAKSKEMYAGDFLKQTIATIEGGYNSVAVEQKQALSRDIEEMRTKKLEQLKYSVAKPATLEQGAKLDDLRKRTDIDEGELQIIAESMIENYGALRSLREIAANLGFSLSVPDYKEISESINNACDYGIRMLTHPTEYQEFEFFGDYEETYYESLTDGLDNDSFTAVPKVEAKPVDKNEDMANTEAKIKELLKNMSREELVQLVAEKPEFYSRVVESQNE